MWFVNFKHIIKRLNCLVSLRPVKRPGSRPCWTSRTWWWCASPTGSACSPTCSPFIGDSATWSNSHTNHQTECKRLRSSISLPRDLQVPAARRWLLIFIALLLSIGACVCVRCFSFLRKSLQSGECGYVCMYAQNSQPVFRRIRSCLGEYLLDAYSMILFILLTYIIYTILLSWYHTLINSLLLSAVITHTHKHIHALHKLPFYILYNTYTT